MLPDAEDIPGCRHHGKNLIHSIHYTITLLERTAGNRATAAGNYILRLCQLLVEANQDGSHAVYDCTLHHYIVCLARTVTRNLKTESCHIISSGTETHEFDRTAARSERKRPQGIGDTPVDKLVKIPDCHIRAGSVEFLYKFVDILVILEVLALHAFDIHFHFNAPFFQAYARPNTRITINIPMQRRL